YRRSDRSSWLPTRFLDARDQAEVGHLAEADAANAELAIDGAGPPAQPAAKADANPVARPELALVRLPPRFLHLHQLPPVLHHRRFRGHNPSRRVGHCPPFFATLQPRPRWPAPTLRGVRAGYARGTHGISSPGTASQRPAATPAPPRPCWSWSRT